MIIDFKPFIEKHQNDVNSFGKKLLITKSEIKGHYSGWLVSSSLKETIDKNFENINFGFNNSIIVLNDGSVISNSPNSNGVIFTYEEVLNFSLKEKGFLSKGEIIDSDSNVVGTVIGNDSKNGYDIFKKFQEYIKETPKGTITKEKPQKKKIEKKYDTIETKKTENKNNVQEPDERWTFENETYLKVCEIINNKLKWYYNDDFEDEKFKGFNGESGTEIWMIKFYYELQKIGILKTMLGGEVETEELYDISTNKQICELLKIQFKDSFDKGGLLKNKPKEESIINKKDIVFEYVFKDLYLIDNKKTYIESFKIVFTQNEIILFYNKEYHKFSKLLLNPVNTSFFEDNSELFDEKNKVFVGEKMIDIINKNNLINSKTDKIIHREPVLNRKDDFIEIEDYILDGSGRLFGKVPKFKFDDRYNRGGWFYGMWGRFSCGSSIEILTLFNIPCRNSIDKEQKDKLLKTINLILENGPDKFKTSETRINELKLEVSFYEKNTEELKLDNNIYFEILKNNQSKIIEIDREFVQKFIKLNNYLKEKSSNLTTILDKLISNLDNEPKEYIIEREEEINFFKGLVYSYNLMVNQSIVMVTSLVEDDMIVFYEIYEVFDKMNVFNTNWENEVNDKLSEINESLQDLNFSIRGLMNQMRSMERNIVNGLQSINTSIGNLENSVNKQLSETNSRLKYENLTNYYKKSTLKGSWDWFDGPK